MKNLIFILCLIQCLELKSQEVFTQLGGWADLPSGYSVADPQGGLLYFLRTDQQIRLVSISLDSQIVQRELNVTGTKKLVVLGSMIHENKIYIFLRDPLFDFGNYNTKANTTIKILIWETREKEASIQEVVYSQNANENFGASMITQEGFFILKWSRTRVREGGKKKNVSEISIYHFKLNDLKFKKIYTEKMDGHEYVFGTISGETFKAFLTKSGKFPEKHLNFYRIQGASIIRKSFAFVKPEDAKYFESHYIFEEYRPDHTQAIFNGKLYLAIDLFIDPNKVQEFGVKKDQTRLLEVDWEGEKANLLNLRPDLNLENEKSIKCYSSIYNHHYFTLYTTRNSLDLSVYDLNNLGRIKNYTIKSTDPIGKLFYDATAAHEYSAKAKAFDNTKDLLQDISQGTPELFIFGHGDYLELEYFFPGSKVRLLPLILEGQFSESEFYLTTYLSNPDLELINDSWSNQKIPINKLVSDFIGDLNKSEQKLIPGLGYFKDQDYHLGVYHKKKEEVIIYSFKE